MLRIRELVLQDEIALQKWPAIVDQVTASPVNKLRIKHLLTEGEPGEAVLKTLNIWSVYGNSPWKFLEVLNQHGLQHLSDKLLHENSFSESDHSCVTGLRTGLWYDVGEVGHNFCGRKSELSTLHQLLSNSRRTKSHSASIVHICGPGGVGKSEIARQYAHMHRDMYDGNVIWIHAETIGSMRTSFQRLSERLGVPALVRESNKDIAERVLKSFRDKKCLFIFDNVGENSRLDSFLPKLSSSPTQTPHILVTSRKNNFEPAEHVLELDVLEVDGAVTFVQKQLPHATKSCVTKLTNVLRRHPIALQQAVAYIRNIYQNNSHGILEYLQELETSKQTFLSEVSGNSHSDKPEEVMKHNGYSLVVYAATKTTLTRIGQLGDGNAASKVMEVLAYLNASLTSLKFLKSVFGDSGAAEFGLELLQQFCLIRVRDENIEVDRLVQELIRLSFKSEQEEKILKKLIGVIVTELDKRVYSCHTLECVFHGLHLFQFQMHHSELMMETFNYVNQLFYLLTWSGYHSDGLWLAQHSSLVYKAIVGEEHENTISMKWRTAVAYYCLGSLTEAEQILASILTASKSELGTEHKITMSLGETLAHVQYKTLDKKQEEVLKLLENFDLTEGEFSRDSGPHSIQFANVDENFGTAQPNEELHLVGRDEEMKILHGMLTYCNSRWSSIQNIVNIYGLPGVGKTALAKRYAGQFNDSFDRNVVWIDSRNEQTMYDSFCGCANRTSEEKLSTIELASNVYQLFEDKRSLFVFDNVSDRELFLRVIPKITNPVKRTPTVLVTSRRNDLTPLESNILQLGLLKSDAAMELAKRYLPVSLHSKIQLPYLVENLGQHPLVLRDAFSKYSHKMPPDELISKLMNAICSHKHNSACDPLWNHWCTPYGLAIQSFASLLLETIAIIPENRAKKRALDLIRAFSCLRTTQISLKFVSTLLPKGWESAVRVLEKFSLITVTDEQINIYWLVQHAVRLNSSLAEQLTGAQMITSALCLVQTTTKEITCEDRATSETPLRLDDAYLCSLCMRLIEYRNYADTLSIAKAALSITNTDPRVSKSNSSIKLRYILVLAYHCLKEDGKVEKMLDTLLPAAENEMGCSHSVTTKMANLARKNKDALAAQTNHQQVVQDSSENTDCQMPFVAWDNVAKPNALAMRSDHTGSVDISKICDLVLQDTVTLSQWRLIVHHLIINRHDLESVEEQLKRPNPKFKEAVHQTLYCWEAYGKSKRAALVATLQEVGLNTLADRVQEILNFNEGEDELPAKQGATGWGPGYSSDEKDATVRCRCSRVPVLVHNYIERRAALEMVHELVTRDRGIEEIGQSSYALLTSLYGLGGIGKTTLARRYVDYFKESFDDSAIFWVDAESRSNMLMAFKHMAAALGIFKNMEEAKVSLKPNSVRKLVESVYEHLHHRTSLFVFDNIVEYDEPNGIIDFLPYPRQGPRTYILATSRMSNLCINERSLQLDVLTEAEADELVHKTLPTCSSVECHELAVQLGRLPLALQQALAYIRYSRDKYQSESQAVEAYLYEFKRNTKKLLQVETPGDKAGSQKTVYLTWKATLKAIAKQKHGELANTILRAMSYMSPDNISLEFLLSVDLKFNFLSSLRTKVSFPKVSVFGNQKNYRWETEPLLAPPGRSNYFAALKLLTNYSMVKLEGGVVTVHRLVQKVVQLKTTNGLDEETLLHRIIAHIYNCVDTNAEQCVLHGTAIIPFYEASQQLKSRFPDFKEIIVKHQKLSRADFKELSVKHQELSRVDFKELCVKRLELSRVDFKELSVKDEKLSDLSLRKSPIGKRKDEFESLETFSSEESLARWGAKPSLSKKEILVPCEQSTDV